MNVIMYVTAVTPGQEAPWGQEPQLPYHCIQHCAELGIQKPMVSAHRMAEKKMFLLIFPSFPFGASLVAEMVKNLPVMKETWVQSLSREDPLEEGMATHSSILA